MRYQPIISQENDTAVEVTAEPTNPFLDSLNESVEPNEPINPTAEVIEPELAEDTSATPEAIEASMLTEGSHVDEISEKVGDVTDAVVGLESIYLQLQKIRDAEGTVSAESHGFMTIAYTQSVRKFPALRNTALASMEDFAMNSDRAGTMSMESVADKLKNGYDAMVKFFKELIERIKAFFGHILSGAAVISRKSKSLLERLKTVNENASSDSEITMPPVLNNPTLTEANITELTNVILSISKVSYRELTDLYSRTIKGGETSINVGEMMDAMRKVFDSYGKMADNVYLGNLSFTNDDFPPVIKLLDASPRNVKTYPKAKVKGYLENNIKLGDAIGDLKECQKDRTTALTSMMVILKNYSDSHRADDKRSDALKMIELISAGISFIRKLTTFENKVLTRAIQTANAINNTCAASIKNLEAHDK